MFECAKLLDPLLKFGIVSKGQLMPDADDIRKAADTSGGKEKTPIPFVVQYLGHVLMFIDVIHEHPEGQFDILGRIIEIQHEGFSGMTFTVSMSYWPDKEGSKGELSIISKAL